MTWIGTQFGSIYLKLPETYVAHQLIHFKTIHRECVTLSKKTVNESDLKQQSNCKICNAFLVHLYTFWECPKRADLWTFEADELFKLLHISVPRIPELSLLNDDSDLGYTLIQGKTLIAGFMASKKVILQRCICPQLSP